MMSLLNRLGLCTLKEMYDLERKFVNYRLYSSERMQRLQEDLEPYEKHLTLDNFRTWLEYNVVPYVKRYKAHRTTIINGTPFQLYSEQPCHNYLKLTNMESYSNFCWGLTTRLKIESPDELVYKLNLKLNEFLKPVEKYRTDTQVWRVNEYWENSEELFDILVTCRDGLDCDSVAFFKYHCFSTALRELGWEDELWRLRVFIVDVLGVGKHAMLGWVKKSPNAWLPIESTLHPDQFERVWRDDMLLRTNYFYQILWSFDSEREYRRI